MYRAYVLLAYRNAWKNWGTLFKRISLINNL
jgi:hypothetical protein